VEGAVHQGQLQYFAHPGAHRPDQEFRTMLAGEQHELRFRVLARQAFEQIAVLGAAGAGVDDHQARRVGHRAVECFAHRHAAGGYVQRRHACRAL